MSKYSPFLIICLILTISGCGPVTSSDKTHSTTDPEIHPEESAILEPNLPLPIENVAMQLVYDYMATVEATAYQVDYELKAPEGIFKRQMDITETYQEGSIEEVLVHSIVDSAENSLEERFYYQYGDEAYHYQLEEGKWRDIGSFARGQMTMFYLAKFLLESEEIAVRLNEDHTQYHVQLTELNDENMAVLPYMLDLPIMLSPNAQYQPTLNYQIDRDTGQIVASNIEVMIDDLGQSYVTNVQHQAKDDIPDIEVDLSEVPAPESENLTVDTLKAGNPYATLSTYEVIRTQVVAESATMVNELYNLYLGQPHLVMQSTIENDTITQTDVLTKDALYHLQDDSVTQSPSEIVNLYGYFVERLANQLANEKVEFIEESDMEGDNSVYNYREFFEEEPESFIEAAGTIDVTPLVTEATVFYAIDYMIDARTHQLLEVYMWSVSPEDEAINQVISLSFTNLNGYNPNDLIGNIDPIMWDSISETTLNR